MVRLLILKLLEQFGGKTLLGLFPIVLKPLPPDHLLGAVAQGGVIDLLRMAQGFLEIPKLEA